jgi:hypothetical protein
MKSGGGSGASPRDVQPNAQVTPYGQASQFNPQYQSVLPVDAAGGPNNLATSQLGDPTRMEAGPPTPLLQQQQAQPIAASSAPADPKRNALAALMAVFGRSSMPGIMGGSYRGQLGSSGGGGYTTSGRGGSFGGTGSSARSGGLS